MDRHVTPVRYRADGNRRRMNILRPRKERSCDRSNMGVQTSAGEDAPPVPKPVTKDAETNTDVTLPRTAPVIWQCHIDGPGAVIDEPEEEAADQDDSHGDEMSGDEGHDDGNAHGETIKKWM